MQKTDGMNYAPESRGKVNVVCAKGEFSFGVIGLDHGHIFAMCNGLIEAGAELKSVYDRDPEKVKQFIERYPQARRASSRQEILEDGELKLVASAIRPDERPELGMKAMKLGKDFFVDKPGMLSLDEIDAVRACCEETGRKYMIYFGERVHVEASVYAENLIKKGEIGRVIHMTILAPHRLNKPTRPEWFFQKKRNGGIITDIGSHQIEQFLYFSGAKSLEVMHSAVANYNNQDKPEFYDFGEASLLADNGASCYFRVDWFTPDGLGAWGDGRVFIIGTEGTIELRKYIDVASSAEGDHVFLVNREGEFHYQVTGQTGFVFFGDFILDCLERTERTMTQEHVLESARAAVVAQERARRISGRNGMDLFIS